MKKPILWYPESIICWEDWLISMKTLLKWENWEKIWLWMYDKFTFILADFSLFCRNRNYLFKTISIYSMFQVIKRWMNTACRDLNNFQWRLVANAIAKCSLPIFVKLGLWTLILKLCTILKFHSWDLKSQWTQFNSFCGNMSMAKLYSSPRNAFSKYGYGFNYDVIWADWKATWTDFGVPRIGVHYGGQIRFFYLFNK